MEHKFDHHSTAWLLLELVLAIKPRLAQTAEQYNLTPQQLYIMGLLTEHDARPMSSLALTMSCDASNITGIVDRLLSLDLITRTESPNDRRIKMISLSTKGKKIHAKFMEEINTSYEETVHTFLNKTEQEAFRALIIKVLENSLHTQPR